MTNATNERASLLGARASELGASLGEEDARANARASTPSHASTSGRRALALAAALALCAGGAIAARGVGSFSRGAPAGDADASALGHTYITIYDQDGHDAHDAHAHAPAHAPVQTHAPHASGGGNTNGNGTLTLQLPTNVQAQVNVFQDNGGNDVNLNGACVGGQPCAWTTSGNGTMVRAPAGGNTASGGSTSGGSTITPAATTVRRLAPFVMRAAVLRSETYVVPVDRKHVVGFASDEAFEVSGLSDNVQELIKFDFGWTGVGGAAKGIGHYVEPPLSGFSRVSPPSWITIRVNGQIKPLPYAAKNGDRITLRVQAPDEDDASRKVVMTVGALRVSVVVTTCHIQGPPTMPFEPPSPPLVSPPPPRLSVPSPPPRVQTAAPPSPPLPPPPL